MSKSEIKTIEGSHSASPKVRIAVVASRFNELIAEQLLAGAVKALVQKGVSQDRIMVVRVPGAWELPAVCRRLARSGTVQGVVALGCVIKGGTPHFDFVAGEAARGLAAASLETGIPIALGVLTTNTLEQALERVDEAKVGHRGVEAALAALQMVSLNEALGSAGL